MFFLIRVLERFLFVLEVLSSKSASVVWGLGFRDLGGECT